MTKLEKEGGPMKPKILIFAVATICLSLMAAGTMAFFTVEDVADNVITTGEVEIELLEWADEERTIVFPEDGISGVVPDTEITKIVEVRNTAEKAAYVRVRLVKSISLAEGVDGEPDPDLIILNLNDTYWTYKDGFYYYNEALEPGELSKEPLLNSVSFDPAMDNLYQNSTVEIAITAYAVQVANNGDDPLLAEGWPTP